MWVWFVLSACVEEGSGRQGDTSPATSVPTVTTPTEPGKQLAVSLIDPADGQPLAPSDSVTLHFPLSQGTGDLGYALSVTGSSGTVALYPTVVRLDEGTDITHDYAQSYVALIPAAEECAFTQDDSAALLTYVKQEDFETLDGVRLRLSVLVGDLETGAEAQAEIAVVGWVSIE